MISGWIFPVAGKNESNITSTYGIRQAPTAGASTFHEGIDISAPTGTDVLAAAAGTVSGVLRSAAKGNYIIIQHDNGTKTEYAHLNAANVAAGERVTAGQRIGSVGNTGTSTGSHLDFRVSVDGKYIDPLKWNYTGTGTLSRTIDNLSGKIDTNGIVDIIRKYWIYITVGLLIYAVLTKKNNE